MSGENSHSEAFFNRTDHHTSSNVARQATLGNADFLRRNLEEGQPWDVCDNRGWFPIHCAASSGHTSCVELLLEHSEKNFKNTKAYNGETPLYLSALHGHANAMKALLSHGADINIPNNELLTVLLASVKGNEEECVKLCIENNVNINAQDAGGWSSLHEAAFLGHTPSLQLLLSTGAKIDLQNSDKATALFIAAQHGHIECLNILIKQAGNVHLCAKDNATPLFIASQEGHIQCVKALLGAGASVKCTITDMPTVLHTAAERGHVEIVRLLIKAGADVNARAEQDVTPLHLAADEDEVECLIELIESGADIKAQLKEDRGTALELSVSVGSVKCCEELIKRGCDPNRCFLKNGTLETTTLMEAIEAEESGCVAILLKYGADPKKLTFSYPIIAAARNLNPESMSVLLKYGAEVDAIDQGGNTALNLTLVKICHAPRSDKDPKTHLECVKVLLKAGADVGSCMAHTKNPFNRSAYVSDLYTKIPVGLVALLLLFAPHNTHIKTFIDCHLYLYSWKELGVVFKLLKNPCSLAHLCRCKVRQIMGRQRLQKIAELPLPKMVQQYVEFQEI